MHRFGPAFFLPRAAVQRQRASGLRLRLAFLVRTGGTLGGGGNVCRTPMTLFQSHKGEEQEGVAEPQCYCTRRAARAPPRLKSPLTPSKQIYVPYHTRLCE